MATHKDSLESQGSGVKQSTGASSTNSRLPSIPTVRPGHHQVSFRTPLNLGHHREQDTLPVSNATIRYLTISELRTPHYSPLDQIKVS